MEFKGTKENWINKNGLIYSKYTNQFLASACTLVGRVCEDRLDGESWLDMRSRTKSEREECDNEAQANAKLIASAPEMLEMLKNMREAILSEDYVRMLAESQKSNELIKKATEL